MTRFVDSGFGVLLAGLLLAGPASAADKPSVTVTGTTISATSPTPIKPIAKKVEKAAAKSTGKSTVKGGTKTAAAPPPEPQPDPVTLMAQARDAQGRGETELALRLAQSAIVAAPALPATYDALGDVYADNHQTEAARSYYGEALSIDPADAAAKKGMAALDHPGQQAADAEGTKTGIP